MDPRCLERNIEEDSGNKLDLVRILPALLEVKGCDLTFCRK